MASKKHKNELMELNKAYEENEIRLKGIIGFAVGLFLLIVITFGLMAALLYKLRQFNAEEQEANRNPMAQTDIQKLPPEPRLQLAPGFGVDTDKGRVNLELGAPASEYHVVRDQWNDILEHGQKNPQSGTVTILPIEEAKERFLASNPKAKSGPDAEQYWSNSRSYMTDQSSGRMPGETRR